MKKTEKEISAKAYAKMYVENAVAAAIESCDSSGKSNFGSASFNWYYLPYTEYFFSVAKKVLYKGIEIGYEYCGYLFKSGEDTLTAQKLTEPENNGKPMDEKEILDVARNR